MSAGCNDRYKHEVIARRGGRACQVGNDCLAGPCRCVSVFSMVSEGYV